MIEIEEVWTKANRDVEITPTALGKARISAAYSINAKQPTNSRHLTKAFQRPLETTPYTVYPRRRLQEHVGPVDVIGGDGHLRVSTR
jgi:hypothetical protein